MLPQPVSRFSFFRRNNRLTNADTSNNCNSKDSQDTSDAPARTLGPASSNEMNRLQTTPSRDRPSSSNKPSSTIRAVPAEPLQINGIEGDRRGQSTSDGLPFLQSSITLSSLRTDQPRSSSPPATRNTLPVANGMVRNISAEFGPMRTYNNTPQTSISVEANGITCTSPGSQWSSAVGRASLGKSGRVIEKLQNENDTLKRELQSERNRADEMRKGFMLAEEKLGYTIEAYEKRLLHADNNEALLKRQDGRLALLKEHLDSERARADAAVESEGSWRAELDKTLEESHAKVEESNAKAEVAQMQAMMMESRNKVLEGHWKNKNDDVRELVSTLTSQIEDLVKERKDDDEKIRKLHNLCEGQAEQIKVAEKANKATWQMFEAYKETSVEGSKEMAETFAVQERQNEKLLQDTQMLLHQIKWAMERQEKHKPTQEQEQ